MLKTALALRLYYLVLLSGSLSLNVYLGWKLKVPYEPDWKGTRIEALTLLDHSGQAQRIVLDRDRVTFVYVVSPSCRYCADNHQAILKVASNFPSVRFVGISLTRNGLDEYIAHHPLPFAMYTASTDLGIPLQLLQATPKTIVLDRQGSIVKVWTGVYSRDKYQEIVEEIEALLT